MENTTTVELQVPVQHEGTTIDRLTFREAEIGDLIDAAGCSNEMERIAVVMASVSSTPLPVIRKIKARDLKNIMKQVGNLVGNEI